ncbi:PEP-CTERM sorting domain-containing protein [Gemmatimonas sp.]|uniref:PEP-CTERM sorting domain-containing protein n=1 Tax=Gemmatimonas sp. TaxID=1962908 RepID=UPI00356330FD
MRHGQRATRLALWMFGALATVGGSTASAQVVLTGVTTMRLNPTLTPAGYFTDTRGTSCCANTYITRGSNPGSDAFLYTGDGPVGSLIPSGITLATGLNTFYLWGGAGGLVGDSFNPNFAVSPQTGSNALAVSSYWNATTNTISGVGTTVQDDFGASRAGTGLSTILGNFRLTITDWSPQVVSRNVRINLFEVTPMPNAETSNVGRLVLNVVDLTPPPVNPTTTTVPEPSTYLLMASGLVAIGILSRKRKLA